MGCSTACSPGTRGHNGQVPNRKPPEDQGLCWDRDPRKHCAVNVPCSGESHTGLPTCTPEPEDLHLTRLHASGRPHHQRLVRSPRARRDLASASVQAHLFPTRLPYNSPATLSFFHLLDQPRLFSPGKLCPSLYLEHFPNTA